MAEKTIFLSTGWSLDAQERGAWPGGCGVVTDHRSSNASHPATVLLTQRADGNMASMLQSLPRSRGQPSTEGGVRQRLHADLKFLPGRRAGLASRLLLGSGLG